MKFRTHNNGPIDISFTSLQGYIQATRTQLESVFGAPQDGGGEDKVTTCWDIKFADGSIACIYDWKRYEEGAPAADEVYSWHIGARHKQVEWTVHDTFREALNLSARAA